MDTIIVKPNQSMLDVVIQATGSLEAGMQFCLDNGVSISDTPEVGTEYVVSDAALALGNAGDLRYLRKNNIVIGTLGEGAVSALLNEDGSVLLNEDGTPLLNENI